MDYAWNEQGEGPGSPSVMCPRSSITTRVERRLAWPPQELTQSLRGLASVSVHGLSHVPRLLSASCLLTADGSTSLDCVI